LANRRLRIAVIRKIAPASRCLAIKMLVELRIQNTLGQGLLQSLEKTVVAKDLLGTAFGCRSSPPAARYEPNGFVESFKGRLRDECPERGRLCQPGRGPCGVA
jgi:hypothetical protein